MSMKTSNNCQIAKYTSEIVYQPQADISRNIQHCWRGEATPAPLLHPTVTVVL